jgi:hypothetical protein
MVHAIIKCSYKLSDDGINTHNLLKGGQDLTKWHQQFAENIGDKTTVESFDDNSVMLRYPIEKEYDDGWNGPRYENINHLIHEINYASVCEFETSCTVYSIDYRLESLTLNFD